MNGILDTPFPVWAIAAVTALGVITRPFRLPEAIWAVLGALTLCFSGSLSWRTKGSLVEATRIRAYHRFAHRMRDGRCPNMDGWKPCSLRREITIPYHGERNSMSRIGRSR